MKSHRDAPYIFLAANDPRLILRGLRADIAPTILERLSSEIGRIKPRLEGQPLTKPYMEPLW